MIPAPVSVDIAIIGGGIAGLWLLNRLCNNGYNAILLEHNKLGGAQTMASQGMIHGGIKYALGGALTGASEAIADMPEHWRHCLNGNGDVDLSNAHVLSDHFYLWSTRSITSKITSFFASKVTRGRVESVQKTDRPDVFQTDRFNGNLYRLIDLVLDVPSVITALKNNYSSRIYSIDWQHSQFRQRSNGSVECLIVDNGSTTVAIEAKRFVFSAGEGNEALLQSLDAPYPEMQRRPLHQVLVKHHYPYALYAHCMGGNPSPRLTVSSHRSRDGQWVWYLGGDLATDGAAMEPEHLIKKAKQELKELFPWLDFSASDWDTLYINRAEPKQKGLIKPDDAFVAKAESCDNVIVAWPTKLTLAPALADQVCALLSTDDIRSSKETILHPALQKLPCPDVEIPCWETAFGVDK